MIEYIELIKVVLVIKRKQPKGRRNGNQCYWNWDND